MTSEEKQEIINEVLAALATNSKTIAQLTSVTGLSESDLFEVAGGNKITFANMVAAILASPGYASASAEEATQLWSAMMANFAALEANESSLGTDPSKIHAMVSRIVLLDSMGSTLDGSGYIVKQGDWYYQISSGYQIHLATNNSGGAINYKAAEGVLYVNKRTGKTYLWDDTEGEMVECQSPVKVINDLVTGGEADALSAEQGKVLKAMIEGLDVNSDTRIGVVDTPSDTVLAAPSARMVKEIYLNLRALFDPTNGLAGIAFLGDKPTWQTVDVPEHTITLDLTDVTAEFNNESVSGSFDASEGEVTIKLTPAQGTMILANNISIMLGSESVPFTLTTNNGSTLVTFILAGNVTFTAVASSGIGVQVSGNNVSANVQGVPLSGDNRIIILSHPEHFDWDGSIGLSVNSVALVVNTDYTITDNQDGTKTITILKTFTSDAYPIVIAANAVEDDFAVLDLTGVGNNVSVMRGSENLLEAQTPIHVYAGETISILPASGYKLTSATINSNALSNGDAYSGYTYQVQVTDVSTQGSTMTVVATATEVQNYGVTLPTDNNFTAALQDANGNALSSPVREGSTIKIAFTLGNYYTVTIDSATMGVTELDNDNTKSSYFILADNVLTIVNVQGDIVVLASASKSYPTVAFVSNKALGSGGTERSESGFSYTDYIELPENAKFIAFSSGHATTGNNNYAAIVQYKEDKTVATYAATWRDDGYGVVGVNTDAKFVRVTVKTNKIDTRCCIASCLDENTGKYYNEVLFAGENYDGRYDDFDFAHYLTISSNNVVQGNNPFKDGTCITQPIDVGNASSISFYGGGVSNDSASYDNLGCVFYSAQHEVLGSYRYLASQQPRTGLTLPNGCSYVRWSLPTHKLDDAYIKDNNDNYLFKGINVS